MTTNATREDQPRTHFNADDHLMQIKGKDYLPVCWRLVWFRAHCPQGVIKTEMVHLDLDRDTEEEVQVWNSERRRSEKTIKQAKGFVIFRAIVEDGKGGIATGTKSEKAASFPEYIEKAESGAIGRALAALGYGTQFTLHEFDEEHRLADSPVERNSSANGANTNGSFGALKNGAQAATEKPAADQGVTEQQLESIRKLCQRLGKAEPENVAAISVLAARKLIGALTTEYRALQSSAR